MAIIIKVLIAVLTVAVMWGLHWFPWSIFPWAVDDDKLLKRPLAYLIGCGVVWAAFTATACLAALHGEPFSWGGQAAVLFGLFASAGLGTIAPRVVKWVLESQATRKDIADYEAMLKRNR